MSHHLALAICKVPQTLTPEDLAEIRRRISALEGEFGHDTALADALADLDPDGYDEIYANVMRDYEKVDATYAADEAAGEAASEAADGTGSALGGARLEDALVAASRPLALRWLYTATESLLEPLLVNQESPQLPYDVREDTLDGNRYLFSGTVTSGDPNESFGLVRLLDASGVIEEIGKISPVVKDGSMRCTRCGYEGDETGGFTAISSATVTAYINHRGECVTWKNAEHRDLDGYTEVVCEECGMDLGDLTPEDLVHLGGECESVRSGGRE